MYDAILIMDFIFGGNVAAVDVFSANILGFVLIFYVPIERI